MNEDHSDVVAEHGGPERQQQRQARVLPEPGVGGEVGVEQRPGALSPGPGGQFVLDRARRRGRGRGPVAAELGQELVVEVGQDPDLEVAEPVVGVGGHQLVVGARGEAQLRQQPCHGRRAASVHADDEKPHASVGSRSSKRAMAIP